MNKRIIIALCLLALVAFAKKHTKEEKETYDFTVGFIEGFGGEGCEKVEQCEVASQDITGDIKKLVDTFKHHDIANIIEGLETLIKMMEVVPNEFGTCKEAEDSLAIYHKKMQRFKDPKKLPKKVSENALLHRSAIMKAAQDGVIAYEDKDFKGTGYNFGKLLDRATK